MKTELRSFWKATRKPFLIIAIILALAFSAIFRASFYYVDDFGRTLYGYRGWGNFSRWTSNILATFIHTDSHLTDISPLPGILAILLLALACCILLYVFKIKLYKQSKITLFDISAVLLLAVSPYFLECITYKFDSVYMALSIFASVLPLFFLDFKKPSIYYLTIFISTLIMCTTYQASSGIFPMALIMAITVKYTRGEKLKPLLILLAKSALAFAAAMLVFKLFLMRPTPEGDYVSNSILPLASLIPGFFSHLAAYYQLIFTDFQPLWLVLTIALPILALIIVTIHAKSSKLRTAAIFITALVLCALLTFGLYPALEVPLTKPRAMYGFGVLLALLALQISAPAPRANFIKFAGLIPAALTYCFIVFAFTYGNALAEQKAWLDFRASATAMDLSTHQLVDSTSARSLRTLGSIGHAAPIQGFAKGNHGHILTRLIPTSLSDDYYWGAFYLAYYFGLNTYVPDTPLPDLAEYDLQVSTHYHDIYTKDDDIIVQLK